MEVNSLIRLLKGHTISKQKRADVRLFFVRSNKIVKIMGNSVNDTTIKQWNKQLDGKRLHQKRNIRQM